jgi:hypothetical protein
MIVDLDLIGGRLRAEKVPRESPRQAGKDRITRAVERTETANSAVPAAHCHQRVRQDKLGASCRVQVPAG